MKRKKETNKDSPQTLKRVLAKNFCGPLKEKEEKEKCAEFYEKWVENEEAEFEKPGEE